MDFAHKIILYLKQNLGSNYIFLNTLKKLAELIQSAI